MIATYMDLKGKTVLVRGAVKPWHVVFVALIAMAISDVASDYMTRAEAADFRPIARELLRYLLSSAIILAFVVIVPELRRSLAVLFAKPATRIDRLDMALTFGLALCWGYGVYRFALCLPLVLAYPGTYGVNFRETLAPFESRNLLFLVGMVIVAPVAEELIFRGYLMNLWIARRGLWFGILASSLVFGLFHFERTVFAAALGFLFALAYLKYDSLWPGIALHAAYNLLAFPWFLGGFFYVKPKATLTEISSWSAEIILCIVFVPLAFAFWRRFAPRGS